jgi:ABC-type dipeptide/oligopeptide/nickel transport system permease component
VPIVARLIRRLAWTVLVLLVLAFLTFTMLDVIPGDPAQIAAGVGATPAQVEAQRVNLGLNHPFVVRFGIYLWRALHGDFGNSIATHQPVSSGIAAALPVSIELVFIATLFNIMVSVPLGLFSALRRNSRIDNGIRVGVIILGGVPIFWLGLMLQAVLAGWLGVFPVSGQLDTSVESGRSITGLLLFDTIVQGRWQAFGDAFMHIVLPAITLASLFIPIIVRTLRSNMIQALSQDYVLLARAKGISTTRVIFAHALRNAATPTISLLGMQVGWMLGSTVLVEQVFGLPGIGAYAVDAVFQKDLYPVVGVVLVVGVIFVAMNLIVDWLLVALDPRAATWGGKA